MENYQPPFTITNRMLMCVSEIAEKVGRLSAYRTIDTKPILRRNNRIKSVHSSLKIEANSLTEGMVRSVLNHQTVIGPEKEIQEVRNAFAAYDMIDSVSPYSPDDLKKLHGVMTCLTVEESGVYRSTADGVFEGDRCIFLAPPPEFVASLIDSLFDWMRRAEGTVHPLIVSCVFHYEFVFIHPFSDGNGRMARLWQTILLSKWNPIFKYIPIESQIERFQEGYYEAITVSNSQGSSTAFIEFMLERINEILDAVLCETGFGVSVFVDKLLTVMEYDRMYSASELLILLGLKSKETLRANYLNPALADDLIEMTIPERPTSRNQKYMKK